MGTNRAALSVLVPCFNNEQGIEACLRPLAWADELVVVDSLSTDSTVAIASRLAARVLRHEYVNSAAQKNWALPQLAHDWVLIVDTDERVPPELREEIERALERAAQNAGGPAGYRIPRANFVFGRQLQHGGEWPDYQIRLFRKSHGRYEDRHVHAHVEIEGECGTMHAPLIHYPHQSINALRRTLLGRYTEWEAREKHAQGIRFAWWRLAVRPAGAFFTRYVLKQGFRDGWQGLLMACVWTAYVFKSWWKLRNLEQAPAAEPHIAERD